MKTDGLAYYSLYSTTKLWIHQAIRQARSGQKDKAREFLRFVQSSRILEILQSQDWGQLPVDVPLLGSHLNDLTDECHPFKRPGQPRHPDVHRTQVEPSGGWYGPPDRLGSLPQGPADPGNDSNPNESPSPWASAGELPAQPTVSRAVWEINGTEQQMKKIEIANAVAVGGLVLLVGEFRDWEVKEFPDKKKPGQFNVLEKSYVLKGKEVVEVQRFLPKGTRMAEVKRPPFKVGERVCARITSLARNAFGVRADGEIEALTE